MKLTVTKEAAQWYKDELQLQEGDYMRFFVKLYGGIPTNRPSYFLGLSKGKEGDIGIQDIVEGITFYFSKQDAWFLEEFDLEVSVGDNDITFNYK